MISLADCIAFCKLDEAEILAEKLLQSDQGLEQIRAMIRDDIRAAIARDDKQHARELIAAMHHFLTEHSEALAKAAPHAEPPR